MKGNSFYYSQISKILSEYAPDLEQEFNELADNHTSREVYFWLTEKNELKLLPEKITTLMSDFYWEIF